MIYKKLQDAILQIKSVFPKDRISTQQAIDLGENIWKSLNKSKREPLLKITVYPPILKSVIYLFISYVCCLIPSRAKKYDICAFITNNKITTHKVSVPLSGSNILGIPRRKLTKETIKYYKGRLDLVRFPIRAWSIFHRKFRINLRRYDLEAALYISFYEGLFSAHLIKVVWITAMGDRIGSYIAEAINNCGGISLGRISTHTLFPEASLQIIQNDICFACGKKFVDVRKRSGDLCKFYIITGYPMDEAIKDDFRRAHKPTGKTIAFYDTRWSKYGLINYDHIKDMWGILFNFLREDETHCLIIKNKKRVIFKMYPQEITSGIDKYKDRISIVYERGVMYPALSSDVVLTASPTITSLCAMIGQPIIYYNTQNLQGEDLLPCKNVYNALTPQDIVYGIKNPPPRQKWEPNIISPFTDGKAQERIEWYIQNLLHGGVEYANNEYGKKWGKDKVVG